MATFALTAWAGAGLAGCLIATAALTPLVMRFAHRVGAVDRGGYRKVFRGDIPLLGGLGIVLPLAALGLASWAAGLLIVRHWQWVWLHYKPWFDLLFSFAGRRNECMTLAVGGIAIAVLGVVDDTRGMRPRWKLLGQLVVAVFVCASGYALQTVSLPFVGVVDLGAGVGGVLTVFWIVGLINAFNLIDGVDGLATGIALIGAIALVALSVIQKNVFITFAGAALTGSLLAFLPFNFPPARIFLGDTGSMLLGYALSVLLLMGTQKSETAAILLAPMFALGFPIFETLISILRRYVGGVPVFVGDNRHTHHRLLGKGYSQPRVALTLYGVALALAVAAVMSALIPEGSLWMACPYALYLGTLLFVAWLAGYLRTTTFKAVLKRRERNKVFQALARYGALRVNAGLASPASRALLELCRQELGLRWIAIGMKEGGLLMATAEASKEAQGDHVMVKTADGQDVRIRFEFESAPDLYRRQDVVACLAGIFDGMRVDQAAAAEDGT